MREELIVEYVSDGVKITTVSGRTKSEYSEEGEDCCGDAED